MSFVGRTRELALLEEAWKARTSAFLPVYGRRRVGKSELLVHFAAGKRALYFVGKQAPAEVQLAEFLQVAARALGEPLLANARVTGWGEALDLVCGRVPAGEKLALLIDEYQWLAEASPELPSLLQERWDRVWKQSGRLLLVLCGSYLGFMEREVLGAKSPLFGRRTGQILLRPFGYREAALFHRGWSRVEQARAYAICGGVPAYLLAFDPARSVEQNVAAVLLDDAGALAREPEFLLREELRELAPYHAVLSALAEGRSLPAGEISRRSGLESRRLPYLLNTLGELGYVQRRQPLSGVPAGVRTAAYALDDPLLRFWFRFVFPQQSTLRLLGPRRSFTELVKPEFESYLGGCFERLAREALAALYAAEGVPGAFEIGEYWDRQVQVDVVGRRSDGWMDLGECKWGATGGRAAIEAELARKAAFFPNPRQATLQLRLFTRTPLAGAAPATAQVRVHTLEELYDLP